MPPGPLPHPLLIQSLPLDDAVPPAPPLWPQLAGSGGGLWTQEADTQMLSPRDWSRTHQLQCLDTGKGTSTWGLKVLVWRKKLVQRGWQERERVRWESLWPRDTRPGSRQASSGSFCCWFRAPVRPAVLPALVSMGAHWSPLISPPPLLSA